MKSPLIANSGLIDDKENYSELQVLKSAAGFYIGTTYDGDGFIEPGSRDSAYFRTHDEAQRFLDHVTATGDLSGLDQFL